MSNTETLQTNTELETIQTAPICRSKDESKTSFYRELINSEDEQLHTIHEQDILQLHTEKRHCKTCTQEQKTVTRVRQMIIIMNTGFLSDW